MTVLTSANVVWGSGNQMLVAECLVPVLCLIVTFFYHRHYNNVYERCDPIQDDKGNVSLRRPKGSAGVFIALALAFVLGFLLPLVVPMPDVFKFVGLSIAAVGILGVVWHMLASRA